MPVIAAPTGGTTYNMGGKLTEEEFVNAICGGCNKAGTLGAVADGIGDPLPVYEKRLQTLKEHGYKAIVGLKPRLQKTSSKECVWQKKPESLHLPLT